jgi:hypothetical protein
MREITVSRQEAFEHCKWGNGAKPGASRKMGNGGSYSMSNKENWVSIVWYPPDFCTNRNVQKVENIALGDTPIDGWVTYWTNER